MSVRSKEKLIEKLEQQLAEARRDIKNPFADISDEYILDYFCEKMKQNIKHARMSGVDRLTWCLNHFEKVKAITW